ncbi:hypothetical protein T12_5752 [Trichinella patagoniensis]|uniref:DUF5641 domain-containing protein n=1 Tax=Trichinella patagoniensis TaxID=990121 RepID=A0A0V0ZCP3_9BILA|nr:hypothetical protein T12_5752 [Trichinella patagoniensis]
METHGIAIKRSKGQRLVMYMPQLRWSAEKASNQQLRKHDEPQRNLVIHVRPRKDGVRTRTGAATRPRYLSSRHGRDQRSGQNVQTNHVPEEEKVKIHAESSELEAKHDSPAPVNNNKLNTTRPILKEDLEDVTKFVHLRTCLTGSALHAINGVTTAAENFPAVVQLLHDQFYRVWDVLNAHILNIFNVTKEVAKRKEGLLTMHDKLNGHLLELKAIGRDLDTAVSGFRMALPHLVSELPQDVQSRWKDQCAKLAEEPTLQIFLDSLAEQTWCAVDPRQTIGAFHTSLHPICPVCQGEHRVTVCQRFLKQQRSERKAAAVRLGMCFICLRQGHTSQRCMMRQRGWRTHYLLTETAPNRRTSRARTYDNSITPPEKKKRSETSVEKTPRVLLANTRGPTRIRFQTVKAIASEQTLVTEDTARALGLVGMAEIATVKGISGIHCTPTFARRANEHDLDVEPIEALTLPQICDDIQSVPVRCGNWKYLQHLRIPKEQAKYAGVSLNDNLETDPNLQADLIGILLRFRQDACRFLWRDCWTDAPPRRYRFTRVCFGLACSPYLALNVLKAHAELNPGGNNQTVKLALSNMNVDDMNMNVSCDDEAEVRDLVHRVPVFLRKGGFHLKRWTCNQAALLDTLPKEDVSEHGKRELGKTFGIYWGKDEDIDIAKSTPRSSGIRPVWSHSAVSGKMKMLPKIKIRRAWIPYPVQQVHRVELHIFGDASQVAYAACAYIRVESINHKTAAGADGGITEITCWSDSRVALAWIKGAPARWKPFVANRVQEIQESVSPQCWRYCPTKENPADIPSRGCSLGTLINTALWWHGPPWLQSKENWPTEPVATIDDNEHLTAEQKTVKVLASQIDGCGVEQVINPTQYSRPVSERTNDVYLSVKELSDAEARWLREVQVKEFGIKPDSAEWVREFEPFLDQDGLLRVGGRLRRSTLPPESKHPIILPHNHPVTELLIKDHHVRQMHAGVNQTLVAIRTRLWIIRARNTTKKMIRSCPICCRVDAQPYRLRMGDLPADRVTETQPFIHTGVDFAGPLFIRPDVQGRDVRVNKAYVCIFTCMTTRAVHLELLREQTTDSFLQGLRNLSPAEADPEDSKWEKLQRKFNEERIRWKFITPRAPWYGGYWERLIRSIKNALRKTIRGALLKYDELHTVLCEIEARINDRPLVLMGDDIAGEAALTPAHFLIGRELSRLLSLSAGIYRRDDTSGVNHLIRRWRYQQRLTSQLWKRWKQEYVTTLTTRGRWRKTHQEPKVGDIVLVHEPSTAWIKWPIGRIIEIHPSEDGVVRSATVKTRQGTVT